jgi:transcriptional regulator with XRE-family HTH domain
MSDLYLILRHRLDHVTDWVMIETTVLREARLRLSLSYEAVARRLHVSSKTYERYEKRGRVPREIVPTVAEILELQIEAAMPGPPRVVDTWSPDDDDLGVEIIARLDRIEKLLLSKLLHST